MTEVEHVLDSTGLIWRLVRDGGMATRAHWSGIETIGIAALERQSGPLVHFTGKDVKVEIEESS